MSTAASDAGPVDQDVGVVCAHDVAGVEVAVAEAGAVRQAVEDAGGELGDRRRHEAGCCDVAGVLRLQVGGVFRRDDGVELGVPGFGFHVTPEFRYSFDLSGLTGDSVDIGDEILDLSDSYQSGTYHIRFHVAF